MATVTNKFNRYVKSVNNATATGMINATVADTDMTVMGLIVTNTYDSPSNTPITVDVILRAVVGMSTSDFYLIKNGRIPEGESLIVIGWDQKLVLTEGDDIIVKTKNASETADVVMSVLEITTV